MDDEPETHPPDPALDTLFVLVAELHREGLLGGENLSNMARRLDMAGSAEMAERIRMIPMANAFDTPETIRSGLHVVRDGGNGTG